MIKFVFFNNTNNFCASVCAVVAFIYYVLSGESDLDTILDRDCHSDKSNDGNDEDRSSAPRDETIRASSESAPSTFGSDEARKAGLKARMAEVLCSEALRRGSSDNVSVVIAWLH